MMCMQRYTSWPLLTSISNFQERVLEGVNKKTIKFYVFIFGCISWSLLLIRNDLIFNNIVIASTEIVLYHIIFLYAEMDNFALEGGAPTYGCGGIEISSTGSIVVI
jgi:hypothetical protein